MSEVFGVDQVIEIIGVTQCFSDGVIQSQLVLLLCDCVDSGASVGFIGPFSTGR